MGGVTLPLMKWPAMVMPSGGVTRGGPFAATGRIRRSSLLVFPFPVGGGKYFRGSLRRDMVMIQLSGHLYPRYYRICRESLLKVCSILSELRLYDIAQMSVTQHLCLHPLFYSR